MKISLISHPITIAITWFFMPYIALHITNSLNVTPLHYLISVIVGHIIIVYLLSYLDNPLTRSILWFSATVLAGYFIVGLIYDLQIWQVILLQFIIGMVFSAKYIAPTEDIIQRRSHDDEYNYNKTTKVIYNLK